MLSSELIPLTPIIRLAALSAALGINGKDDDGKEIGGEKLNWVIRYEYEQVRSNHLFASSLSVCCLAN